MARGYPDFFGYSTFPKYGQIVLCAEESGGIGAGVTDIMFQANFKGRTYGGLFDLTCTLHAPANYTPYVIVDGVTFQSYSIQHLLNNSYNQEIGLVLQLVNYNVGDIVYSFLIKPDYTFDTHIEIGLANTSAGGLVVPTGQLLVAHVT